ncbi:hypothetical protein TSUD_395130, partial [Trifolium subterraneum]
EQISIKITEVEYLAGVLDCQNVLHGRFTLPKGSSPIRLQDLKQRILKFWKTNEEWSMVSLGKGYIEFIFSSLDDLSAVRSIGFWNLSPGLLRTFAWSADFNPFTVQPTNAQVWIHIHGLAHEYWRPKILFEIAGAVGSPLALDEATKKRTFVNKRNVQPVTMPSALKPVEIAYNQVVADEDPLIEDLTRDIEVRPSVLVGDVLNFDEELLSGISVPSIDLAKKPRVDQESITPDLRIVGSWSDAVTDLDYIQDPPSWCGTSSIVIASDVALASDIGHKVYTDEEETTAAINYLKNRYAALEEPFTVVSKAKKKKPQKGFSVSLYPFYGK